MLFIVHKSPRKARRNLNHETGENTEPAEKRGQFSVFGFLPRGHR